MNKTYIIIVLVVFFFMACGKKTENTSNIIHLEKRVIINDTLKERKVVNVELKENDVIDIPSSSDNFSEVIFYYESYIGEAYSRATYKKHFDNNSTYLDSLIDRFENAQNR